MEKLEGDIETADERGSPVVKVDLSGKRVTDKDLDALAPLTKIRELNLSQTQITDAGPYPPDRFIGTDPLSGSAWPPSGRT